MRLGAFEKEMVLPFSRKESGTEHRGKRWMNGSVRQSNISGPEKLLAKADKSHLVSLVGA